MLYGILRSIVLSVFGFVVVYFVVDFGLDCWLFEVEVVFCF